MSTPLSQLAVMNVSNDSGVVHVTLSDGRVLVSRGFVDRAEQGQSVRRVALYNPDTDQVEDGPVIDQGAAAFFRAAGIDAGTPSAVHVILNQPAPSPVPVTVIPTVPAPPHASAPPAHHASFWASVLAFLGHAAAFTGSSLSNPAVVALIPPKYQGIAVAVGALDQIVESAHESGTPTDNPLG